MTSSIRLLDGRTMPQLGFGVWQVPDSGATAAVKAAIEAGYRSIDTAAAYENEEGVGRALAEAGVPRADLFITTKLWNDQQGYDSTLRAFDASMKRLGLERLDLYLIHWPAPRRGAFVETWRAFAKLQADGRVTSIGVSNFTVPLLERLKGESGVVPAVNQVELHPRFQQRALRAFHEREGIATESWSPLGQGRLLTDPLLVELAGRYRKTPAQIILRWHLDNGLIAIPKSVTPARIRENFDVFDFALAAEDRARIDGLDDAGGRIGPDPDRFG